MKKTKIMAVLLSLVMALGLLAGCDNTTPVVTLDDVTITQPVFHYLMEANRSNLMQYVEGLSSDPEMWNTYEVEEGKNLITWLRENIREELIRMAVYTKKAEEMGLSLTSEEEQTIRQNKASLIDSIGGRTIFKQMLNEMNTNEDAYDTYLKTQALANKVYTSVSDQIQVDDTTLREIFDQDYIGAQHILIKTIDDSGEALPQEEITAARTKAEELLNRAKAGEDFTDLVMEYSEDKQEGSDPEEYYIFKAGEMVEEFETAAFALEENEISEIVTTTYGYHIIKRINITDDDKYFEETKETIKSDYLADEIEKQYEEWKAGYNIVVDDDCINSYTFS